MRIDAHHHFWTYGASEYAWIRPDMAVLRRDFTPETLEPTVRASGIDAVVSVQASQTAEETRRLLGQAGRHAFIAGVVGWVPLVDPDVPSVIEEFRASPWLKGVRHVVQDEPDDRFLLREDFNRGVAALRGTGLVYDLLIFPRQLPAAVEFVDRHPDQPFVLDHLAKPRIRSGAFDREWETGFRELAKRGNVAAKVSGLVTEVLDEDWSIDVIRPYWETALDAFGPDRLMFGSDWPVCLLRSDYDRWVATVEELAAGLSVGEQVAFWGGNASRVYRLGRA